MNMITQYAFAGDYTGTFSYEWEDPPLIAGHLIVVEAIEKAVDEVAKFDAGKSSPSRKIDRINSVVCFTAKLNSSR